MRSARGGARTPAPDTYLPSRLLRFVSSSNIPPPAEQSFGAAKPQSREETHTAIGDY